VRTHVVPAVLVATTVAVPPAAAVDLSVGPVSLSVSGAGVEASTGGAAANTVVAAPTTSINASGTQLQVNVGGAPSVGGATQTVQNTVAKTDDGVAAKIPSDGAEPLNSIRIQRLSRPTARRIARQTPKTINSQPKVGKRSKATGPMAAKPNDHPQQDGSGPSLLELPTAAQRLSALLAMIDGCVFPPDLTDADDRRVVIVPITQLLDEDTMAQFEATLLTDQPGREKAIGAVRQSSSLRAVLARAGYADRQVVAVDVESDGATYVFVRSIFNIADLLSYLPLPNRDPGLTPTPDDNLCLLPQPGATPPIVDDWDKVASLGELPLARDRWVSKMSPDVMPRIVSVPPAPPLPTTETTDAGSTLLPDTDLVAVSDLLEIVAKLDSLMLALNVPEEGGAAPLAPSTTAPDLGMVVARSHALADAASRTAGLEVVDEDANAASVLSGSAPGLVAAAQPIALPQDGVSAALALAGVHADAYGDASLEGADAPSLSAPPPEPVAFSASACADFSASVSELSDEAAASFGVAEALRLAPVPGCAGSNGVASQMRDLLWSDVRVRSLLVASGYGSQDILGASLGDYDVLSIYVGELKDRDLADVRDLDAAAPMAQSEISGPHRPGRLPFTDDPKSAEPSS